VQAPIDRFLTGDAGAISDAAKRGWTLYNGKARCNNCHGHVESFPPLADVIAYYDRGGNANPFLDGGMRPLGLTEQEKADLVELLKTSTSDDLARFQDLVALMPR
jgi:cytochrome c peroxidase